MFINKAFASKTSILVINGAIVGIQSRVCRLRLPLNTILKVIKHISCFVN